MADLGSLYFDILFRDKTEEQRKKLRETITKDLQAKIDISFDKTKIAKDVRDTLASQSYGIQISGKVSADEIKNVLASRTYQIKIEAMAKELVESIEKALEGKTFKANVAINQTDLVNLIRTTLQAQGFTVDVKTNNLVTNINTALNGKVFKIELAVDATKLAQQISTALQNHVSKTAVEAKADVLKNSITTALANERFKIHVVVDKANATQAVQQALAQVRTWNGKYTADDLRAEKANTEKAIQMWKRAQEELARVKKAHLDARSAAQAHTSASINLGGAMGSNIKVAGELGSTMASLYSVHMIKEFLANVIEIGGELEHQKIAMDTIFGDKGKTIDLFGKIKDLARNSPFGVMELTKSVKALSAYGVEYNEIYDTAKRLADISAATSVDINRLILAFGKTKSRTFLDGLEAKQFAYANIPIYDMLSKKLTELEGKFVSVKEVMGRIKKREIGFDMVKEVLWDLTDEGGKFYNMQEQLAGSVKTSWKLVKDNIELMYGELAESLAGPLKATAEILQGLTREWRTVSAVMGAAIAVLGVYRLSQLLTNVVMTKGTATTYAQIMADKKREASMLRMQSLYMTLLPEEKAKIANARALTNAELEQLFVEEKLTQKDVIRLIAMRKLNQQQIQFCITSGIVSAEMVNQAQKSSVLTYKLKALGLSIWGCVKAMWAFVTNPWTIAMAAVTAITALIHKNNEEMDKAKELGDNMFTKAEEAAKNLHETLKAIANDFDNLSAAELARSIEKMETTIKDYAINPDMIIAKAAIDDDGNVRTQKERAEILRQQVEYLEQAAKLQETLNMGNILTNSIDSADGGWFDDNLTTDMSDFVKKFDEADNAIAEYINDNADKAKKIVQLALQDETFAQEAEGLRSWQEQFALLVKNANTFSAALQNVSNNYTDMVDASYAYYDGDFYQDVVSKYKDGGDIAEAKKELLEELGQTIEGIKTRLQTAGVDLQNLSDTMKLALTQMGNDLFASLVSIPQEHQEEIRNFWFNSFGFQQDYSFLIQEMVEQFRDGIDTLGDETKRRVENGLPLDDAAKTTVNNFMTTCATTLKAKYPWLETQIQSMLDNGQFTAHVLFAVNRNQGIVEWQQSMLEIWGTENPEIKACITTSTDIMSAYKSLAELKKDCDDWMTKFGTLNLPIGFKWTAGTLFTQEQIDSVTDPITRQLLLDANSKMNTINSITESAATSGVDLSQFGKNNNNGNKKDKFLEGIKERFNLIKKAYDEYKKWLDLVGADQALLKVKESGIFDELFQGNDPSKWVNLADYKSEIVALMDKLKKGGLNTKERREQWNTLSMLVNLEIPRDEAKRAADELRARIENELSAIGKKWDIYQKLIDAGMMKQDALNFAGLADTNGDRIADLRAALAQRFRNEGLSLYEVPDDEEGIAKYLGGENSEVYKRLYKPFKEFKEAVENDGIDIKIKEANAIARYRSVAERIAKLNEEYAEYTDLTVGENGELAEQEGMTDGQKAMFREYQEKLAELKGELLALLPEWEAIFGDHTYQSYGQIQTARGYAQQMVDNAHVQYDADGKPTIFTSTFTNSKGETQEIKGTYKELEKLKKVLDELYKVGEKKNPFAALISNIKAVFSKNNTKEGETTKEKLAKLGQSAADSAKMVGDFAGQMSEMFEAMGESGAAEAMNYVAGAMDSIGNIANGFAQGGLIGGIAAVAGEAMGWITKAFQAHDNKLQKSIEKSQLAVKQIQNIYDAIERRMERFLGNGKNMKLVDYDEDVRALNDLNAKIKAIKSKGAIQWYDLIALQAYTKEAGKLQKRVTAYEEGGAYGYQRQLMKEQLDELEKQRQAELDKKKTDKTAVADYENQIDEMKVQIRQFAEETADSLYGINLKDWASQIGDSLMDAWKKGEDGAEAFKNTVANIMSDVMGNVLKLALLEPMMADLQTMLFGEDGQSGMFGKDFELQEDEVETIGKYLMEQSDKVDAYNAGMDMLEEWLKKNYGISLKETDNDKSGPSKGIQSVTESTADLLASYINAIRADVSMKREYIRRIVEEVMPAFNILVEAQLRQLEIIANNTGRNADAAEKILDLINSNTNPGKGFKIS